MPAPASRRVAAAILASVAVLCALAPMNGVSFALVALTAYGLKQLPLKVRLLAMAVSLAVCVIGVFEVATNGSWTVIASP